MIICLCYVRNDSFIVVKKLTQSKRKIKKKGKREVIKNEKERTQKTKTEKRKMKEMDY